MPKLRLSAHQKRVEIITAWQRHYNIHDDAAAKMLGIGRSTYRCRKKVGNWKLEELHRAIRAFRIPGEEALELLTVGCYPLERFIEKKKKKR